MEVVSQPSTAVIYATTMYMYFIIMACMSSHTEGEGESRGREYQNYMHIRVHGDQYPYPDFEAPLPFVGAPVPFVDFILTGMLTGGGIPFCDGMPDCWEELYDCTTPFETAALPTNAVRRDISSPEATSAVLRRSFS